MPSFAPYLGLLNEWPSSPQYTAAELQRERDRQFLEGTQWKTEPYKNPEGFKTVELNSNFMLIEGTLHRLR